MISDARQALAGFFRRELERWSEAGKARSERDWAAKNDLPPHLVRRARHGRNVSLERLQELAQALRVEPWQLLFPGFVRGDREHFPTFSTEALSVALEVDRIEDEERRRQVAAGILNVLGQAAPAAPSAATAAPPAPAAAPIRVPARSR